MEVYFSKKLTLNRSNIFGKNEGQNIKECSEVKLQTTIAHFAQTHFLQPQLNSSLIPAFFWAPFKSELKPKLGQHGPKSTRPFPFFLHFLFPPTWILLPCALQLCSSTTAKLLHCCFYSSCLLPFPMHQQTQQPLQPLPTLKQADQWTPSPCKQPTMLLMSSPMLSSMLLPVITACYTPRWL